MAIEGGCYCGELRYSAPEHIVFKGQCLCRECQYISGGGPNIVVALPEQGFHYTKGSPAQYKRSDLENPVTRHFCANCGTHILTASPGAPGILIVKVGTLDRPELYDKPDHVIWTAEKQSFHHIPAGVPTFEGFPPHG